MYHKNCVLNVGVPCDGQSLLLAERDFFLPVGLLGENIRPILS